MTPVGITVACAVSFTLGAASFAVLISLLLPNRGKRRERNRAGSNRVPQGERSREPTGRNNIIKRIGVMNLILVLIGAALLLFTLAMIDLFKKQYAIPDTLVTCVFATLGGECGVMGWIKTTKERTQQRKWDKEDRRPSGRENEPPKG